MSDTTQTLVFGVAGRTMRITSTQPLKYYTFMMSKDAFLVGGYEKSLLDPDNTDDSQYRKALTLFKTLARYIETAKPRLMLARGKLLSREIDSKNTKKSILAARAKKLQSKIDNAANQEKEIDTYSLQEELQFIDDEGEELAKDLEALTNEMNNKATMQIIYQDNVTKEEKMIEQKLPYEFVTTYSGENYVTLTMFLVGNIYSDLEDRMLNAEVCKQMDFHPESQTIQEVTISYLRRILVRYYLSPTEVIIQNHNLLTNLFCETTYKKIMEIRMNDLSINSEQLRLKHLFFTRSAVKSDRLVKLVQFFKDKDAVMVDLCGRGTEELEEDVNLQRSRGDFRKFSYDVNCGDKAEMHISPLSYLTFAGTTSRPDVAKVDTISFDFIGHAKTYINSDSIISSHGDSQKYKQQVKDTTSSNERDSVHHMKMFVAVRHEILTDKKKRESAITELYSTIFSTPSLINTSSTLRATFDYFIKNCVVQSEAGVDISLSVLPNDKKSRCPVSSVKIDKRSETNNGPDEIYLSEYSHLLMHLTGLAAKHNIFPQMTCIFVCLILSAFTSYSHERRCGHHILIAGNKAASKSYTALCALLYRLYGTVKTCSGPSSDKADNVENQTKCGITFYHEAPSFWYSNAKETQQKLEQLKALLGDGVAGYDVFQFQEVGGKNTRVCTHVESEFLIKLIAAANVSIDLSSPFMSRFMVCFVPTVGNLESPILEENLRAFNQTFLFFLCSCFAVVCVYISSNLIRFPTFTLSRILLCYISNEYKKSAIDSIDMRCDTRVFVFDESQLVLRALLKILTHVKERDATTGQLFFKSRKFDLSLLKDIEMVMFDDIEVFDHCMKFQIQDYVTPMASKVAESLVKSLQIDNTNAFSLMQSCARDMKGIISLINEQANRTEQRHESAGDDYIVRVRGVDKTEKGDSAEKIHAAVVQYLASLMRLLSGTKKMGRDGMTYAFKFLTNSSNSNQSKDRFDSAVDKLRDGESSGTSVETGEFYDIDYIRTRNSAKNEVDMVFEGITGDLPVTSIKHCMQGFQKTPVKLCSFGKVHRKVIAEIMDCMQLEPSYLRKKISDFINEGAITYSIKDMSLMTVSMSGKHGASVFFNPLIAGYSGCNTFIDIYNSHLAAFDYSTGNGQNKVFHYTCDMGLPADSDAKTKLKYEVKRFDPSKKLPEGAKVAKIAIHQKYLAEHHSLRAVLERYHSENKITIEDGNYILNGLNFKEFAIRERAYYLADTYKDMSAEEYEIKITALDEFVEVADRTSQ